MFYGKWDTTIDKKWRLSMPAALGSQLNNFVFLKENEEGCIRIERLKRRTKLQDYPFIYGVEVQKKAGNCKRILIPQPLRGSTSFYFGKNVILVGRGSCFEVWPRP